MAQQSTTSTVSDVWGSIWQELPVLAVLFVSFVLFRHVLPRTRGAAGKEKRKACVGDAQSQSQFPTKDFERAPRSRLAAKAEPVFTPAAVEAAQKQMMSLLANREFTRALNMFRSFERDGRERYFRDEEMFSAFVQSAIRVGKVDVVDRMIRMLIQNGTEPSPMFWQTTLKMLSSRKHFQACVAVHAAFSNKIPVDKVAYSCLINAALDCGEPARAAEMLHCFEKADLEPKDHVIFFRTFVALGDVAGAERIFRKLGSHMSPLMANLMLLTVVNAKCPDHAMKLLKELHDLEVEKDGEKIQIVDAVSYNTVIKGYAQVGQPRRCFDCLAEMQSRGIEPDDVTCGSLIDVCIGEEDMGAAGELVETLMGSKKAMDTVMCTLFIKGFVRAGDLKRAMGIYEEMTRREGAGSRPDVVTYSVLIKAHVDEHNLEQALGLVDDMVKAGYQPDDIILTHLLEGCRHAGNMELGKKLFNDMMSAGVEPSDFTLITLVKLFGRCGAHEDAYRLVETWEQKHGGKPSVIHYTCLMSGCIRMKQYEQAWRAYELMCQSGIPPDKTAFFTIMPGLVAAEMWERVVKLTSRALGAPTPVPVPTESLNSALWQMIQGGKDTRVFAEQLARLMNTGGVGITPRNRERLESSGLIARRA